MDKDGVHMCNGILLSHKKNEIKIKNEIMSLAVTWMNLEIVLLRGVSQKELYHILLLVFRP